jgi:hypothetical protein
MRNVRVSRKWAESALGMAARAARPSLGSSMAQAFFNPLNRTTRPGYPEALARLRVEARELLGLADDVVISVNEIACRDPDCPGIETVVAVLREGQRPRTARIRKPIIEVTRDDLGVAFGTPGFGIS